MRPVATLEQIASSSLLESAPAVQAATLIVSQSGSVATVIGEPGIAKTDMTVAFAKAGTRYALLFYGSQRIPEDIGGYMFRSIYKHKIGDREIEIPVMKSAPCAEFVQASLEPSVLVFEELTNCEPAMQAAMLGILCSPPPNSWVIATANEVASAANGHGLEKPAVNRMWIGKWESDVESWEAGIVLGHWATRELPIAPDGWMTGYPKWGWLALEFSRSYPDLIGKDQLGKDDRSGTACHSPLVGRGPRL